MTNPLVSVVMPVYNASQTVGDAVSSIQKQTLTNWELIIIDDRSFDETVSIIRSLRDSRIRIFINSKHLGTAASLNKALAKANGRYIARMDADDISDPERFSKQIEFLKKHSNVDVLGGGIEYIGDKRGKSFKPTGTAKLKVLSLFQNPLVHPTVMFRAASMKRKSVRYDPTFKFTQDFELWARMAGELTLENLHEVLLYYRWHNSQSSTKHFTTQQGYIKKIHAENLRRLGIKPTRERLLHHKNLSYGQGNVTIKKLEEIRDYLLLLERKNSQIKFYPPKELEADFRRRWFLACRRIEQKNWAVWKAYWQYPHSEQIPSTVGFIIFTWQCLRGTIAYAR